MSHNRDLILRFIDDVLRKGNFSQADEFVDADFVLHLPGSPGSVRGIDGLKLVIGGFHAGFPDRRVIVEDMILAGDKVAVRVTQEGAHQGAFQGIAPTGKQISVTAAAFFRIANGKVAEEWLSSDRLGLLQQLGADTSR